MELLEKKLAYIVLLVDTKGFLVRVREGYIGSAFTRDIYLLYNLKFLEITAYYSMYTSSDV